MPSSYALACLYKMPIGFFAGPLGEINNPDCHVEKCIDRVPRCPFCRAYCCCYCTFQNKLWKCFVCGRESMLPAEYDGDPANPSANSVELIYPSYRLYGPLNYYPYSPPENVIVLLIDVSLSAFSSKMLYYATTVLKEVLSKPETDDWIIYFYTFDDVLHEYDFTGKETRCNILDPDIMARGGGLNGVRGHNLPLSEIRDKLL